MIDVEEVRRVASLARLELSPDALEKMAAELGAILDYIDQLREVESQAGSWDETGEMLPREDRVVECAIPIDDIERNAPDFRNGFFVVPPVIG